MRNLIILVLIAIVGIVLGLMVFGQADREYADHNIEDSRDIATNWMETEAPTYVFDGSGLELIEEEEVDSGTFEFTFNFESSAAGYGDREDEPVAQVITPHTTVVTVKEGEVISAITDDVFSELDGQMIEEEEEPVAEDGEETVSVYFMTVEDGQEGLTAVERTVSVEGVELATLEALLEGPYEEERDMGYSSAINEEVEINSLSIEEGVAYVDFSSDLDENIAGSATVMAIRGQIKETLKQFDSIDEVVISVEGETEEVLQP